MKGIAMSAGRTWKMKRVSLRPKEGIGRLAATHKFGVDPHARSVRGELTPSFGESLHPAVGCRVPQVPLANDVDELRAERQRKEGEGDPRDQGDDVERGGRLEEGEEGEEDWDGGFEGFGSLRGLLASGGREEADVGVDARRGDDRSEAKAEEGGSEGSGIWSMGVVLVILGGRGGRRAGGVRLEGSGRGAGEEMRVAMEEGGTRWRVVGWALGCEEVGETGP